MNSIDGVNGLLRDDAWALPDFTLFFEGHAEAILRALRERVRLDGSLAAAARVFEEEGWWGRVREFVVALGRELRLATEGARESVGEAWGRLERFVYGVCTSLVSAGVSLSATQGVALAAQRCALEARGRLRDEDRERALGAAATLFGRVVAMVGEAFLAARERRSAACFNATHDALVEVDAQGRVRGFNGAAEALFGCDAGEVLGATVRELFDDAGVDDDVTVRHFAFVLRRRDGAQRSVDVCAVRLAHEPGAVTYALLDTTALRDAELELSRSERRFAATLASLQEGVTIADRNGTVVFVNPEGERITGISSRGTRTQDWEVIHDQMLDARGEPFQHKDLPMVRALAGEEVRNIEMFIRNALVPDGVYINVNGAPIRDRDGETLGAIVSFHDITQRKRLERDRARWSEIEEQGRRAREANRLKSEFLANMSHELRTPLNSILGFAELLHDEEVGPVNPRQKEFLGDVLASGRHLLRLINDVLDLSKVEAGRMEFHPEPIDVRVVVGEVVSILRATAAGKRIELEYQVDDDARFAVLDPARFKQVLYNYLSNALKFTDSGGRVSVRVKTDAWEMLELEVEDTGIGIAAEDQRRLFSEFQQLDAGIAKRHGGTGLGLALTRRLVEAQGGSVAVRSELGRGSVFSAVLPKRGHWRLGPELDARSGLPRPGAPTVLVVEDDVDDRDAIVRALIDAGYAVETAINGTEAITRCKTKRFDAVTLDLILPDMTGLDVLRALRSDRRHSETAVVVITVITEWATAGFAVHDVLAKPIDGPALLASLRRAGVAPDGPGDVLVIDDDERTLELVASTLEQLGYRPQCFRDGAQGLMHAALETPRAVILELRMPGLDGLQFLDRFRQIEANRTVPVLVWTLNDLSSSDREVLRSRAQGILQKGRGPSELVSALRTYLKPATPTAREE